jgi:hypothetical protein
MNPLDYLLPNTLTPRPNSMLDEMKYEAINSLLSFNSQNTSERLSDISNIVSSSLGTNKSIGFKEINGLIESILVWLLNTPYILINSQGNEGLTPHFSEYLKQNNQVDNLVPYSIASLIQDGCTYTWGGFFGTLSFEFYLNRTQNHYISTSQLCDIVTKTLLSRIKNSYTEVLSKQIGIDSVETDLSIYRFPIDYIQSFSSTSSSLKLIDNLLQINDLINLDSIQNVSDEFKEIYQDLYIILINNPLRVDLTTFNIFHTDISNSLIKLSNEIHNWCIKTKRILLTTNHTEIIQISQDIQSSFKESEGINPLVQLKSYLLLLPLPGGLNQLIGLSTLVLLHRVYILTHPSKLPNVLLEPFQESNVKYDSLMYSDSTFMDQVLSRQQQEGLFSRIMSLIYLSGRLLRKSNIRDFILMGNNLSYISGWRDTDTTNIIKLID